MVSLPAPPDTNPWAPIAWPAVQTIIAFVAEQDVLVSLPLDVVVAGTAANHIFPIAAVDGVVSAEAGDDVIAARAVDDIIASGANNRDLESAAGEWFGGEVPRLPCMGGFADAK